LQIFRQAQTESVLTHPDPRKTENVVIESAISGEIL